MNKVHKLNIKLIKHNRRDNKVFYTCYLCHREYHQDLTISYLPTNYGYYKDSSRHYCIKCFNLKFY
jgi:plasmid replication initiation protein